MDKSDWDEAYRTEVTPWRKDKDISVWLRKAGINSGKALDLGCGTGEIAAALASRGFEVEALDYSEQALKAAARKNPDKNIQFVNWDLEDLENYPFHKPYYDLIIDNKALAFIHDKDKYLKTIFHHLNGCFILSTFSEHRGKPALAINKAKLEKLLGKYFAISETDQKTRESKISVDYFLQKKWPHAFEARGHAHSPDRLGDFA